MTLSKIEEEEAIESLVTIVKYPTVSALGVQNGSYVACAEYLLHRLNEIGLTDAGIVEGSLEGNPLSAPRGSGMMHPFRALFSTATMTLFLQWRRTGYQIQLCIYNKSV
jgi:hypothetical protein